MFTYKFHVDHSIKTLCKCSPPLNEIKVLRVCFVAQLPFSLFLFQHAIDKFDLISYFSQPQVGKEIEMKHLFCTKITNAAECTPAKRSATAGHQQKQPVTNGSSQYPMATAGHQQQQPVVWSFSRSSIPRANS